MVWIENENRRRRRHRWICGLSRVQSCCACWVVRWRRRDEEREEKRFTLIEREKGDRGKRECRGEPKAASGAERTRIVERDTRTQHEDDDDDTTATRTNDHLARSMQQDARSCPSESIFHCFSRVLSHYRQVKIGGKTRSTSCLKQRVPRGYYCRFNVLESNVSE